MRHSSLKESRPRLGFAGRCRFASRLDDTLGGPHLIARPARRPRRRRPHNLLACRPNRRRPSSHGPGGGSTPCRGGRRRSRLPDKPIDVVLAGNEAIGAIRGFKVSLVSPFDTPRVFAANDTAGRGVDAVEHVVIKSVAHHGLETAKGQLLDQIVPISFKEISPWEPMPLLFLVPGQT